MRQLVLYVHMTLNGVVTGDPAIDKEDFGGQWAHEANVVGEASEALVRLFERADAILLGAGSYRALAKRWPEMSAGDDHSDDVTARLADKINHATKYVVSRTPETVDRNWGTLEPAQAIPADHLLAQVKALKQRDGGDIVIFGSPVLVRALTDARLIDEYHCVIHPVVIPVGDKLFDRIDSRTDLTLDSAVTLEAGGLLVSYRRA